MKKVSQFYLAKHRRPKDLARQIQLIEVENQRKKLDKIVTQRKEKLKQAMHKQQLILPNFSYLKKQYVEFSTRPSNASKEPFITQKIKRKLVTSDRAYSSTPNLKTGKTSGPFSKASDTDDPIIVNRMFVEFNRLIDEQNRGLKLKVIRQQDRNTLPYFNKKNNSQSLKKTYFQKFFTDKFNFYKTNDYQSIGQLSMYRSKTDRINPTNRQSQQNQTQNEQIQKPSRSQIFFSKARLLQLNKSKFLNSTVDSDCQQNRQSLDCSIFKSSRHKIKKMKKINQENKENKEDFKYLNRYDQAKSRTKTYRLQLSKVSFEKNINSVEL